MMNKRFFLIFFIIVSMVVTPIFGMKKRDKKKAPKNTLLTLVLGDITRQEFDDPETSAVVNAANERLIGGAGVAQVIQLAAGPDLMTALRAIKTQVVHGQEIRRNVGGTKTTPSFNMSQRKDKTRVDWIIHAVGPDLSGIINRSLSGEIQRKYKKEFLRVAYRNSLWKALKHDIKTIAFPAISTNIFGYDIEQATPEALGAIISFIKEHDDFEEIRFVAYNDRVYDCYRKFLGYRVDTGVLEEQKPVGKNPRPERTYKIVEQLFV